MSSLNRYLELQERKFDKMQQRREHLRQQKELEQHRFEQLTEHLSELRNDIASHPLLLQNTAAIQTQLLELCDQQQVRIDESHQELQQQHQACMQQIGFNMGLQRLLDRRAADAQAKLATQEQKQLDELVCLSLHKRN